MISSTSAEDRTILRDLARQRRLHCLVLLPHRRSLGDSDHLIEEPHESRECRVGDLAALEGPRIDEAPILRRRQIHDLLRRRIDQRVEVDVRDDNAGLGALLVVPAVLEEIVVARTQGQRLPREVGVLPRDQPGPGTDDHPGILLEHPVVGVTRGVQYRMSPGA